MRHRSLVTLLPGLVALAATVAACGDDAEGASSATRTPSTTTAPGDQNLKEVVPGGDCECADGSKFAFWERPADPKKVVLFLDGGGTCSTPSPAHSPALTTLAAAPVLSTS